MLLLAGCVAERAADDAATTVPVPERFDRGSASPAPTEWFHFYGDPELAALVDRALGQNFELLAAWERIREAEALADQAEAAFWPRLEAEAGAGRERREVRLPERRVETETSYRASLAASYELDLWGRLRARSEASTGRAEASRADARALAMSLAARITEAWLDLIELGVRGALIADQQELARELLDLAETRLGQGQGSALDVSQQEQRRLALEATESRRATAFALAEHRLAVLLGEAPQGFRYEPPKALPTLPPRPPTGLPAALLERRPDVRAAWWRLHAADAESAEVAASRLPQLRLSAELFTRAATPEGLFDTLFWSLGAAFRDTLFSGGSEAAELDAVEARARQALLDYAGTMLTALREVADALEREAGLAEQVRLGEEQLAAAREALELARDRYGRGAVDYQRVLNALDSRQELERSLLSIRRDRLAARLQLHRALGGRFPEGFEALRRRDEPPRKD